MLDHTGRIITRTLLREYLSYQIVSVELLFR